MTLTVCRLSEQSVSELLHHHRLILSQRETPTRLGGQLLREALPERDEAEQVRHSVPGRERLGLRESGGWSAGGVQPQGDQQHRDQGGVRQTVSAGGGVPLQVCRVQQGEQALHPQPGRQENSTGGLQIRSGVSKTNTFLSYSGAIPNFDEMFLEKFTRVKNELQSFQAIVDCTIRKFLIVFPIYIVHKIQISPI